MKIIIDNIVVHFSNNSWDIIKRFSSKKVNENESGGILLGQVVKNEVFIKSLSLPNKFDKATKNSFNRNKDIAQIIVDYEFQNSSNKTIYIGEWHNHHEKKPSPSPTDMNMIKKQFLKNIYNTKYLIMLIIGSEYIYVGLFYGTELKINYAELI